MKEIIFGYEYNETDPWINGWPHEEDKVAQIIEDLRKLEQVNRLGGTVYTKEQLKSASFCENPNIKVKFMPYCTGPYIIDLEHFDETGKFEGYAQLKWVHDIKEEKYIFPITVYGFVFLRNDYFKTYGMFLSDKVKDDCRKGLCKILLHEFYEGTPENLEEITKFIKHQASLLNIPESSFIYADSNLINQRELQKFGFVKGFSKLWWERFMQHLPDEALQQKLNKLSDVPEKQYHFVSLNRRIRRHRLHLTKEIFKKWNNKSLWTLTGESQDFNLEKQIILKHLSQDDLDFVNSLPKLLDINLDEYSQHHKYTSLNLDIQTAAYINIVSETYFYETNTAFISEKTFKPIMALQPFIVLGPYNTLKRLKEFGYKTFHPFINEEYDDIENSQERFDIIMNEIDRLSKYSISDMQTLVRNCADICIHNYFNLTNSNGNFTRDKVFIQELLTWIESL